MVAVPRNDGGQVQLATRCSPQVADDGGFGNRAVAAGQRCQVTDPGGLRETVQHVVDRLDRAEQRCRLHDGVAPKTLACLDVERDCSLLVYVRGRSRWSVPTTTGSRRPPAAVHVECAGRVHGIRIAITG